MKLNGRDGLGPASTARRVPQGPLFSDIFLGLFNAPRPAGVNSSTQKIFQSDGFGDLVGKESFCQVGLHRRERRLLAREFRDDQRSQNWPLSCCASDSRETSQRKLSCASSAASTPSPRSLGAGRKSPYGLSRGSRADALCASGILIGLCSFAIMDHLRTLIHLG